ncbi:MAG TPA: hypothetical protein VGH28_28565 [Polyangiaceae bacterium]|jgi:hypothetical protein
MRLAGAVFAATLLLGSAARADGEHDAAVASFQEGLRLVDAQDWTGAAAKFRESLAHESSIGARLDLADCEDKLGDPLAAWRDFRAASRLAADRGDARRRLAADRAVVIQRKLLVVTLPSIPRLDVRVDGAPVDAMFVQDGAYAVAPGAHDLEATAPQYHPKKEHFVGAAGEVHRLELAPIERPKPVLVTRGGTQRTAGLAIAAVGLAGLAAGGIFGGLTFAAHGDAVNACAGTYPSCTNTDPAAQRSITQSNSNAQTFATLSDVTFAVGGAALVAGALLFLLAPSSRAKSALAFSFVTSPSSIGASLEGEF